MIELYVLKVLLIILSLSLTFCFSLYSFAEEVETYIESEQLHYDINKKTYYLKGSVRITRGDATITADDIEYREKSSFLKARGNVIYSDSDAKIEAAYAEIDLDKKKGKIRKAQLFFKKDNYHISGDSITKKNDKEYFIENASFTTCDAPVPAWCFNADRVDLTLNDKLIAKGVTFKLKNIPTLYTPLFAAPFQVKRKTGFLIPGFGFSNDKGGYFNLPFYWVISENRDATFNIDTYTKRGLGQGIEYRYVERGGIEGKWRLYHLNDTTLKKDFYHIKGKHNQFSENGLSAIFDINYINEKEYLSEYSPDIETRIERYLESSGEISFSTNNKRFFLLSQYWVDLQDETEDVSQKLPEIGFTVNPFYFNGMTFSMSSSLANFWSENGISGQRVDIFPRVYHKVGDTVRLTQSAGVRTALYSLTQNQGFSDSPHSEALVYTAWLDTTLKKRYKSFTHILEPSVSYNFISEDNDAPVFDSTEEFDKESTVELSFMNYFMTEKGKFLYMKLSNPYDFHKSSRAFGPLKLQAGLLRPFFLRAETSYDYHEKEISEANSEMSFSIHDFDVSVGERFNRSNDIFFLTGGIGYNLLKNLRVNTSIWYDTKGEGLRHLGIDTRYTKQCWGLNIFFAKKPDDYSLFFTIELKGLGEYRFFEI